MYSNHRAWSGSSDAYVGRSAASFAGVGRAARAAFLCAAAVRLLTPHSTLGSVSGSSDSCTGACDESARVLRCAARRRVPSFALSIVATASADLSSFERRPSI
eukprot:Amastigsp_a343029_4.p3 type:complete len:103 gc:universal Amastigsp_a343029_4:165-473(+)